MSVQFIGQEVLPHGLAPSEQEPALRLVEVCGRTAYKSEDKITDESARAFVLMLKRHGHLSVLEHSNLVLALEDAQIPAGAVLPRIQELSDTMIRVLRERNAYHRFWPCPAGGRDRLAISGSLRAWIETLRVFLDKMPDLGAFLASQLHASFPALFEPAPFISGIPGLQAGLLPESDQMDLLLSAEESDLPVFVFKFVCDRGITHEIVRHRVLSYTQESTRYVNYMNRGMTLITPEELQETQTGAEAGSETPLVEMWRRRGETLYSWYKDDLERGLRPEIARDILPNLLKSEIFVSGRWSGWKHFIKLRDSRQAHPRIRDLARGVRSWFTSRGLEVN